MDEKIVVLVTINDAGKALEIATEIVTAKLAACANIIPEVRSIYLWEGNACDDKELLMVIKTARRLFEPLKEKIRSLHPYSVPEIIALPIVEGHKPYLDWIDEVLK